MEHTTCPRNISETVLFKPSKKTLYKMEEAGSIGSHLPGKGLNSWGEHMGGLNSPCVFVW